MSLECLTEEEKKIAARFKDRIDTLRSLKKHLSFAKIYYPGSGADPMLKISFIDQPVLCVHLDDQPVKKEEPGTSVLGKIGSSPFATGSFDAVFMQCLHPTELEFDDMLRTLRLGGALIYSTYECNAMHGINLPDIELDARLVAVELPSESSRYRVFEHIAPPSG